MHDINSVLAKAIVIASKAHEGQRDKEGYPYILHPLRVMQSLQSFEDKVVAVLHDVIEDTPVTATDLEMNGIPQELVDDVVMVSRLSHTESHWQFIERICKHGSDRALRVKIADVVDNSDVRRTAMLDEKDTTMGNRCIKTFRLLDAESRRRAANKLQIQHIGNNVIMHSAVAAIELADEQA